MHTVFSQGMFSGWVMGCSTLQSNANSFPKWFFPFALLTMNESFHCSVFLTTSGFIKLFYFCHSIPCETVSDVLDLHFLITIKGKYLYMDLWVIFVSSVPSLCILLLFLIITLLDSEFFYILDSNLHDYMCLKYLLPMRDLLLLYFPVSNTLS